MKKGIFIGEMIKFGWKTFCQNWAFFVGVLFLAFITPFIPWVIARYFAETQPLVSGIFFVIYYILAIVVNMGLVMISLKFSAKELPQVSDLYTSGRYIFNFFISQFFYTIIVLVGTILLIFPAIIWGTKFGLYQYFVVEKGAGPLEALQSSSKITEGAKWDLFGLFTVNSILMLAGAVCFALGLFITFPITMVGNAYAYRKLLAQTESIS